MLKSLSLVTGFSLVLIAQAAIGQTFSQIPPQEMAQAPEFNQVDLVCYMQTSDGRVMNLTSICGSNVRNATNGAATPNAPNNAPTDYTDLGNLDTRGKDAGAPPCYGLDAQGNPCPASR